MQRIERPKHGPGKRGQVIVENLPAHPVYDPDADGVKDEKEEVVRGRIKAGDAANQPIRKDGEWTIETSLGTGSFEREQRSQKDLYPQMRILDEGILQDELNIVIDETAF
jgi:hypothetical protein